MSSSFFSSRGTSRSFASVLKVAGIAILVIGLVLVFAGCGGKAGIVGKWTDSSDNSTVEFTSDGKMLVSGPDGAGSVELGDKLAGDKITLTLAGQEMGTVPYKLDGDSLTVDDPQGGAPLSLTRAK